jgi:hypothetical protein
MGPVILLAIGVISGCNAAPPGEAARFNNQGGNDAVPCLVHQASPPDAAYEGGPESVTLLLLPMLHYYVANGNKPYCDGNGPNSVDRAWLQSYLHLGADATHISRYAAPAPQPGPAGGTH